MEESTISELSSSPINDSVEDKLSLLSVTDKVIADETVNVGDAVEDTVDREKEVIEENVNEERENNNSNNNIDVSNHSMREITLLDKPDSIRFPVRPEAEECAFYMKTGDCKFGLYCKFNHPPLRNFPFPLRGNTYGKDELFYTASENVKDKDDSVEKEGRLNCKYFHRPGGCKYGKGCKFNHSKKISYATELNYMGLPIRQGEQECPYYIRNGSCKFGAGCRFNHPNPTSAEGLDTFPSFSNKGPSPLPSASQFVSTSWSQSAALNENPPYMPMMLPPTQGILSRPQWSAYQGPVYLPPGTAQMAPTYVVNRQPSERNVYSHQQEEILSGEFPERPGQPECNYFIKTGNCKYKSACKFHHPKNASEKSSAYSLSELGLPLRPGENMCTYYSRYGICKYGPSCKYDHPVNHALTMVGMSMTPGLGSSMVNNHAMTAGS